MNKKSQITNTYCFRDSFKIFEKEILEGNKAILVHGWIKLPVLPNKYYHPHAWVEVNGYCKQNSDKDKIVSIPIDKFYQEAEPIGTKAYNLQQANAKIIEFKEHKGWDLDKNDLSDLEPDEGGTDFKQVFNLFSYFTKDFFDQLINTTKEKNSTLINISQSNLNMYKLCHGLISDGIGGLYKHAWIENYVSGKFEVVIDITPNIDYSKIKKISGVNSHKLNEYYSTFEIQNPKKYSYEDALNMIKNTGHYGPWHNI